MKAGILRTTWIGVSSIMSIANLCVKILTLNLFGKLTREKIDLIEKKWAKKMLKRAKVNYQIYNPYNIDFKDDGPFIVMCNHTSLYDIPLSLVALPGSIRMLAKKELAKIPLLKSAMDRAEYPFVNRHNRHDAIKDLNKVKKLINSGIVMWFAPEGTRSKDGKLGKFKKGGFITAIEAKAKIIPIGIRGASEILPAKTYQLHLNQNAEIHIGSPVDASKFRLDQKEQLISLVETQMKQLVGQQEEN